MADNSQPSRNPANSTGDVSGGMREILAKFLQSSIDDMLPAKIVAYDRDKNRATIKILMAMVTTSGDVVSRNQLASIPVINIGGGGCILSFNFVPGDLGYIKATDRDIADFLKNYSEAAPSTKRIHDFSNGVFIPDVMTRYTINSEDAENCVLQTLDGTVRVSLFPDKLKLTAPEIETNATTKHIINTPEIEINAPIFKANSATTTFVTTTMGISGDLTNNGINIGSTHIHSQGNDGNGDTEVDTGGPHS